MPVEPTLMTVACPYCATRYLLPELLLGPGGARVRCPGCGRGFVVPAGGGEPVASAADAGDEAGALLPSGATAADPGAAERPEEIARGVLAALAARHGGAIEAACASGRVFSEFGPALFTAFDEYRRRAGKAAGSAPFRAALRERWGVELPGAGEDAGI